MRFVVLSLIAACAAGPALAADLSVRVEGLRSTAGAVEVCLWRKPAGFPDCAKGQAVERRSVPAGEAAAGVVFRDVAPGTLAVSLLHDENGDGRLQTGLLGVPKEGIGVSNNALPRFSAPKFKAAAFSFDGDAQIAVRVKYY